MARNVDRRLINENARNINQVIANLRRRSEHAVTAAKAALRQGVDKVVLDAKSRVPVKTGKLRDSIRAIPMFDGAVFKITADAENEKGVKYAQYVEYSPRINRPFLYPAVNANISALSDGIKNAVQNSIRRN